MLTQRPFPLPFSAPSFDRDEEEAVLRVLRSGWITTGPETAALEKEFAAYVGSRHALAVTSCTAALFIALKGLGIGPGDDVVVPSLTWPATPNAVELCGARTVFCDVDYASVCATPETIAAVMTPRTRAVMTVHFGGLACDLDPILEVVRGRDAALVEDAAHAVGTRYKGVPIGMPHGAAACFSFHPIKNITTAEGGMITCSDEGLHRAMNLHKFHGVSRDAWKAYGTKNLPLYDLEFPALKFNLPDLLSAIGRVQLAKLDGFVAKRRLLADRYFELLADMPELDLPVRGPRPDEHAWHLFAVKVSRGSQLSREELMERLSERNVRTGLHFLATHRLKYYRENRAQAGLEAAREVGDRILSLPLFPGMADEDVRYVCDALKDCFAGGAF